jgi:PadR family transcriptional regulator PadR
MVGGNSNFMAGVPELLVLRLLKDREMYGYEIVQAIAATTHQAGHRAKG